jgi:ribosomal protein L23
MEAENKLIFVVDRKAKKTQIKEAVEKAFNVKVLKVNTMISNKGIKKAYILLSIDTPAIDVATQLGLM